MCDGAWCSVVGGSKALDREDDDGASGRGDGDSRWTALRLGVGEELEFGMRLPEESNRDHDGAIEGNGHWAEASLGACTTPPKIR